MQNFQGFNLVQVSASLDLKLGGPVSVVQGLKNHIGNEFETQLYVFGTLNLPIENCHTVKTFANNRFGFICKPTPKLFREHLASADIVLIHGHYLFSTLLAILHTKNARIFIMPHGSLENYQSKKSILRKRIFDYLVGKLLSHRRYAFLLGSKSEVESVRNRFPIAKIFVVGLGVEEVSSQPKIISSFNRPVELLCMSRISKKKRIDLCIQAVAKLNADGHSFSLKIYGTGDIKLENDLRILAKDLNVSDYVFFCGFATNEVRRNAFRNSDIFLLPSENENFAVAVAESIYESRPVIVSKYVAMHEFVDKYEVGKTIQTLDPDTLTSAILDLVGGYNKYALNCYSNRELLSWGQVSKVWIETLREDW